MAAELDTRLRLLLAQAVHQEGSDWGRVAALLDSHPLCSTHPAGFFTEDRCRTTYHELLKLNDISATDEALVKPKGKEHLKLARVYFFERVSELRSSIFGGIEDYKRIAGEISDIQAGKWDDRLASPAPSVAAASREARQRQDSQAEIEAELVPPSAAPVTIDDPGRAVEAEAEVVAAQAEAELASPIAGASASGQASEVEVAAPATSSKRRKATTATGRRKGKKAAAAAAVEAAENSSPAPSAKPEDDDEALRVSVPPFGGVASADAAMDEDTTEADASAVADEEASPAPAPTKRGGRKSAAPKPTRKRKRTESVEGSPVAEATPDDSKPAIEDIEEEEEPGQKRAREARFRKSMSLVHDQIVSDTRSAPFRDPVRIRDAASYFDAIKRPMDLKTAGARVKQGLTTTVAQYRRDMLNIFANAVMFNSPYDDNEIVKQAREMAELAEMRIAEYEAIESRNA